MPEYKYTSGKLHRSHLLHYIDASFGGLVPIWFLIGKDIEDTSVALNPDTETKKNILDETSVQDNGYEPALDVDTYYANPEDAIYEKLKAIAMRRLTGDQCKTKILEVIIDKTTGAYEAYTEDVIVKPQSYGGPQGGVNIPYNIAFAGNRQNGSVTFNNKVPTFAPTTITLSQTTVTVADGSSVTITATTVPASQTVTWTSSDDDVALVENGEITGVDAGTAVITAKMTVNGIVYTATCMVTVTGV